MSRAGNPAALGARAGIGVFLGGNHLARRLLFPMWRYYDPAAQDSRRHRLRPGHRRRAGIRPGTGANIRRAAAPAARDGKSIDLIVMGTTGPGGMAQLLVNSVRERVVRTARCPVLIVKHP